MEWAVVIPIVVFALLCPLMMIGMIVGGWVMACRATGGRDAGHSGHGMMCMMHGLFQKKQDQGQSSGISVAELKAERDRLDEVIARADKELETEPVASNPGRLGE
jgi:hypothetical protein